MAWLPEKPAPRDRWLTRSEAAALIRTARTEPKARWHLPLFILIALYTGARRTSILELRWTQNTEGGWIDLKRGRIDFNPTRRRQTKKRRPVVPVPPRLLRFLKYARTRSGTDWVVAMDGLPVRSVKRSFATAARKAELGDLHIHDLRHTAASWLAQSSTPAHKSAAYLGMSEETFERVYGKHDPTRFDDVLEVFK
jgi:integrase